MGYLKDLEILVEQSIKKTTISKDANCVLDLFLRLIKGKLQTHDTKKIIIYLNDDQTKHLHYSEDYPGMIDIYYNYDHHVYANRSSNYEKKKFILQIIINALIYIAKKKLWSIDTILDVYNSCLELGIKNEWWFKNKFFSSPDKKNKAGVYYIFDVNKFQIFIIILNKDKKEIARYLILEDSFDSFKIEMFVWADNDIIKFKFDGPKKEFKLKVSDMTRFDKVELEHQNLLKVL